MKYSKVSLVVLLAGILMLNGCMLKRVFSDDESGGMHDGMHEEMHGGMMHGSSDE